MDREIFNKLKSSDYQVAREALSQLLKNGKLDADDIAEVLTFGDKLIIGNFLTDYTCFDKDDLAFIEKYICENLDDNDRLYVSDLIEFATYWNLQIPYEKCLEFLKIYEDDHHYVLLASIDYIFENFKYSYISEFYDLLNEILYNSNQHESAQLLASFVLFRISLKKDYLIKLIDLTIRNQYNTQSLKNILKREYNDQKYFDYHDLLTALVKTEL